MGVFQNNLMGAAAAAASGGGGTTIYDYQIPKSVRMNKVADNDGGNFSKTFSGSPTSTKKGTFSTWLKRASAPGNETHAILVTGAGGGSSEQDIKFENNKLRLSGYSPSMDLTTTQLFRDVSAWYHIVVAWDTTQGTSTNRVKAYVNGEQITSFSTSTYPSEDQVIAWFSNTENRIGLQSWNDNNVYNGYMAETIGIDGTQYAASDFGETVNGVWVPKDASGLTFGNNGFYLNYASSGDLGNDVSGNNNDWTANNISSSDQMLDSPSFNSDSNGGNFATLGPLWKTENITFAEGNLAWSGSANERGMMSNWAIPIGTKAYFEYYASAWAGGTADTQVIGINQPIADLIGGDRGGKQTGYAYQSGNGYKQILTASSAYGYAWTTGDVIGVAVDRVNHTINFYANSAWQGTFSISSTMELFPFIGNGGGTNVAGGYINFGQDGTFAGTKTAGGNSDDTGYGNFFYDVPAGFLAMCAGNLPVADEVDPAQTDDDYPQKLFSPTLYTGNGSATARDIDTGVASDWVWIKNRGAGSTDHMLYDSSRGVGKYLRSNKSDAEDTSGTSLSAFNSNGFQLSDNGSYLNAGSNTYVAWNWRANGGTTAANTVGGTDSVTQVDPSKALSIVTYTGISGSSGSSTVGHGMGVVPQLIFHKARNASGGWWTQFAFGTNANYFLELNGTRAQTELAAGTYGAMSRPTTSVFSINGVDGVGGESRNYVAYCFANIEGYCKVGSFVGNGSTDGPFIYTGFRPSLVVRKRFDGLGSWLVKDDARNPVNDASIEVLAWNDNSAENAQAETSDGVDFLSNGFKLKATNNGSNGNGLDYVYLALSFNPFKYSTAF